AVIDTVKRGTPAESAGLRGGNWEERVLGARFTRGGDVIVAIDGQPVHSAEDVVRIVTERVLPGERVRFTIVRAGKRRDLALKLALTEACTNSVRHAYGNGKAGVVEIVYELQPDRLVVEVADTGSGFSELELSDENDELSEGGLGIAIIRAVADELEIAERAA